MHSSSADVRVTDRVIEALQQRSGHSAASEYALRKSFVRGAQANAYLLPMLSRHPF
jgi:hypothetical protein